MLVGGSRRRELRLFLGLLAGVALSTDLLLGRGASFPFTRDFRERLFESFQRTVPLSRDVRKPLTCLLLCLHASRAFVLGLRLRLLRCRRCGVTLLR